MKALSVLIMVFQLVFGFSGLQNVGADQADKDYKTGLKYYNGDGVTKDYTEAFRWFRKAADQGDQMAMIMIKKLQLRISE